jgi:hypothetical protein
MSELTQCHVIGCAITDSPENASIMIEELLIDACFVVLFISSVQPSRSMLCQSSTSEPELIERAHQSTSNRSLMMIVLDEPDIPQSRTTVQYWYANKTIN